jgi:S-adenosylmethionine:tRNA ribosyltransferase-isomerase
MKLDNFHYKLPEQLIAQYPLHRRDQARLMIVDRTQKSIVHDTFTNIGKHLPRESCLVLNDSKVIAARLLGKRASGGQVEIFLLNKLSDGYSYEALMRPMKRLKVDEKIIFNGGSLVAQIQDKDNRTVRFNHKNINAHLNRIGHIPLPPYIKRPDRASDRKYYQTVYARKKGSVASPTAGLHFTNRLLSRVEQSGHTIEKVTLHINYATFKPVEEQDITKHKMHWEDYSITNKALNNIHKAREGGRKIVAVGTTSCRVLESVAVNGKLKGSTNIFMYPGYKFQMVDTLVTNFHLPYSTLLMLVSAFGGKDLMVNAYREAIKQKYRFFSYGDAMMII